MRLLALSLFPLAVLAGSSPPVEVTITSPPAGYAAFGQVTVAAEVKAGEPVRRVVFFVDGRQVGAVTARPFSVVANLGQDNVEHRFRVVAHLASGASGEATLVTPRIAVDQEVRFDLQQLYVSAMKGGERVLDLKREEFEVVDGGEDQEITAFARGDIPFTAVVLLDSSMSMQGERLTAALAARRHSSRACDLLDEVKLVVYCDHTIKTTPFTSVPEVLMAGLGGITAHGGTALSEHLYLALKLLEERQGRRVVVVLSDGIDSHSALSMPEVLFKARQSQALIYWIRLQDELRLGSERGRGVPVLGVARQGVVPRASAAAPPRGGGERRHDHVGAQVRRDRSRLSTASWRSCGSSTSWATTRRISSTTAGGAR